MKGNFVENKTSNKVTIQTTLYKTQYFAISKRNLPPSRA